MGKYLELPFVLAVGLAALLSSACSLPGGSTNWSAGSLGAEDGEVSQVRISIEDKVTVLPIRLREGWSLRYEGGATAAIRDADHRQVGEVAVDAAAFRIASGRHTLTLDGQLAPEGEAKLRLELRPHGREESVAAR